MSSFGRDEWGRSGRLGQRHFRRLSRGRRASLDLRRRQAVQFSEKTKRAMRLRSGQHCDRARSNSAIENQKSVPPWWSGGGRSSSERDGFSVHQMYLGTKTYIFQGVFATTSRNCTWKGQPTTALSLSQMAVF